MAAQNAESITRGIDLSGKVALVTGVNSGIGLETMRVLALRGARVLGTARTLEKAHDACAGMQGEVVPLECELTQIQSIRRCVTSIAALDVPLHIVVANAGVMALPSLELVNGVEKQFAINHLGHFLLLTSLLPQVVAGRGRVAVVSSAAHTRTPQGGIDFDNLAGERGYSPWRAYARSKLANILFANELARRLPDGCTSNSLHPGVIRTGLARHMQGAGAVALNLIAGPFMMAPERGAATSCYVVAHPDAATMTGRYFANCAVARPSALARDRALAERLWGVSEELIAAAEPTTA